MCAIFGVIAKKADSGLLKKVIIGLSRLQHRGEESAGIIYGNHGQVWIHKKYGLVSQVFTPDKIQEITDRQPTMIIGQTHYSTSGNKSERNIPPQWVEPSWGRIGLVHNGNIPNLKQKKKALKLEAGEYVRFDEDNIEIMNDSEFMIKYIDWLMVKSDFDAFEALKKFMAALPGSYSAALLSMDGVYIFRDSYANRPLFWVETADGVYFGSETCSLQDFGGEIKDFMPGRIMEILPNGAIGRITRVNHLSLGDSLAKCVFEEIYFSAPDSWIFTSQTGSYFRFLLGRELAVHFPVGEADFVVGVPESGRHVAEGFASQSGKPNRSVILRDGYIGRTFIRPSQQERKRLAEFKYRLVRDPEILKDKKIVLVDDSIIRLITMRTIVPKLFQAGVGEVHVRIAAPPIVSPCYYGIDMPSKEELVAANLSVDEIRREIGANSLAYNSLTSLGEVVKICERSPFNFCKACFTGEYPIPLD